MPRETRKQSSNRLRLQEEVEDVIRNPWDESVCGTNESGVPGPSILTLYELLEDDSPPNHCETCKKIYFALKKTDSLDNDPEKAEDMEMAFLTIANLQREFGIP